LRAASERLRAAAAPGASPSADAAAPAGPADEPADDFSRFLTDLTQYLNSTDYLVAFLGDSLRQVRGIIDELAALSSAEPVVAIARQADALESERASRVARAAALARLAAFAWDGALVGVRDDIERITVERSGAARNDAGEQADAALAR